jgi:hypothetical protein
VAEHEAVESAAAVPVKTVDDRLIDELVSRAQAEGLQLTGEGGLLQQLTKRLLESAQEDEITDHLGDVHGGPLGGAVCRGNTGEALVPVGRERYGSQPAGRLAFGTVS